MHPALQRTNHRAWPLPRAPWIGRQSWHDVLFAHWRIDAAALEPYVPRGLVIEEFDGSSWVGVVPFRITDLTVRGLPGIPGLSNFPELNVRLYVERDGKPGVWFLSLDADNAPAVWTARQFFHLPYFGAAISTRRTGPHVLYESERRSGARARFAARYQPTSPPREPRAGTLEHFLTERYCLYAQDGSGRLERLEIHHQPWPLQDAEGDVDARELLASHSLPLTGQPERLHYAERQDVVFWAPHGVGA